MGEIGLDALCSLGQVTWGGKCINCGRPCKMVCAGCTSARFCSTDCQRQSWSQHHRSVCGKIKLVRGQIMDDGLMETSGMRGTKQLEVLASGIGVLVAIKEPPSRKANGRLRGKQARCTGGNCANPMAEGARYVFRSDGKIYDDLFPAGKQCVCAHTAQQSPLALSHLARLRQDLLDPVPEGRLQHSRRSERLTRGFASPKKRS